MNENYIKLLKKMNNKAKRQGDIPVSTIIVDNNSRIIAKCYNKKYYKNNPFYHAEILAIIKASKILKTSNLSECTMYTTLKPCKMCEEVIKESKIKKIYYILDKKKEINNKIDYIKCEDSNDYFQSELSAFFEAKR